MPAEEIRVWRGRSCLAHSLTRLLAGVSAGFPDRANKFPDGRISAFAAPVSPDELTPSASSTRLWVHFLSRRVASAAGNDASVTLTIRSQAS